MAQNEARVMLQGWYDYREVALSVLMAVSASYAALELAGRAAAGRLWLTGAIFAMTSGIWGMHYTGMLAFKLPVPAAYDLRLVAASWLPAIAGSTVALYLFTGENWGGAHALAGSIFSGGAISGLHYISMMSMRATARQLHNHPLVLEESGLACALEWYATGFGERSGIKVTLEIPAELGRLPKQIETAVFRMVQECLTNIHLHSGSATAKVRIAREDGNLSVEVEDEGCGMPTRGQKFAGGLFASGVGLAGIGERVKQLGGRLEIDTSSRGTKVAVILPLKQASLWQKHAS